MAVCFGPSPGSIRGKRLHELEQPVFMERRHFPKKEIYQFLWSFSLSDVRPSNNLTFCNASARQGSSLIQYRARLNFQVYALRDIDG